MQEAVPEATWWRNLTITLLAGGACCTAAFIATASADGQFGWSGGLLLLGGTVGGWAALSLPFVLRTCRRDAGHCPRASFPLQALAAMPHPDEDMLSGCLNASLGYFALLDSAEMPMRLRRVAVVIPALAVLFACAGPKAPVEVAIVGVDYAYQAPQHIAAGPTAFTFANHGSVLHEIQLFRLRDEVPRDSAVYYLATSEQTDTLAPDGAGSVLWAPAGKAAHERILVDARSGTTYAVFCQFQNADSLPIHTKLGMIALIQVD